MHQIVETKQHQNGTTQQVVYNVVKKLGTGAFATCYQVENADTKALSACKVIEKSSLNKPKHKAQLMQELKIHRGIKHPHICFFEHWFEDAKNIYILLELCVNQSLADLLQRRRFLHELEVQCYMLQIISALRYCEQNQIVHRDMKPANLLLNGNMEIKVGDFGLAVKLGFKGERRSSICGTPNFMAPEQLSKVPGHSYSADVWAMGVIMFIMLTGHVPFAEGATKVEVVYKNIEKRNYDWPTDVQVSDHAKDLIFNILKIEKKRFTLDQIQSHKFFLHNNIPMNLPLTFLHQAPDSKYIELYPPLQQTFLKLKVEQVKETSTPRTPRRKKLIKASSIDVQDEYELKPKQKLMPLAPLKPGGLSSPNLSARKHNPTSPNVSAGKISKQNSPNSTQMKASKPQSFVDSFKMNVPVFVSKWVDYSSKYGVGYTLSDQTTGVIFNDKSILFNSHNQITSINQTLKQQYSHQDIPQTLHKKYSILQHFQQFLGKGANKHSVSLLQSPQSHKQTKSETYICKCKKTEYALIFRLSNKFLQLYFKDKTELFIDTQRKVVLFINREQEQIAMSMPDVPQSTNTELKKRFKYAYEVLTSRQKKSEPAPNQISPEKTPESIEKTPQSIDKFRIRKLNAIRTSKGEARPEEITSQINN